MRRIAPKRLAGVTIGVTVFDRAGLTSEADEHRVVVSGNGDLDSALVIGGDGRVEVKAADCDHPLLTAHLDLQRLGGKHVTATSSLWPFVRTNNVGGSRLATVASFVYGTSISFGGFGGGACGRGSSRPRRLPVVPSYSGGRTQRRRGRPEPVLSLRMRRERNYWTPQILPLNSPFHRPLTPNGLLGSAQRMNGPAISSCPEADANRWVPFTTFAVAL